MHRQLQSKTFDIRNIEIPYIATFSVLNSYSLSDHEHVVSMSCLYNSYILTYSVLCSSLIY